jgi:hypothetical protein
VLYYWNVEVTPLSESRPAESGDGEEAVAASGEGLPAEHGSALRPVETAADSQASEPRHWRPARDSMIDEPGGYEPFVPEKLRNLSARLALGAEQDVSDDDITSVLGPDSLKAFRYAQQSLRGLVRKVTGEPAFCHSADVALRALDLGYPDLLLQVCLLHDAVEDSSDDIITLFFHLKEIERLFAADVALDVRILTNRYQIILQSLSGLLPENLPFEPESVGAVCRALDELHAQVPPLVRDEFAHEFYQLRTYFLPSVNLAAGRRRGLVDRQYTVLSEVAFQAYRVYAEQMGDDALLRRGHYGSDFYDRVLTVKFLDQVDNLRTSGIATWSALERILVKTETFLDKTFYLHDYIRRHGFERRTAFLELYDYLKCQLIEQMGVRRKALAFLADSRFALLTEFLVDTLSRLQRKYLVCELPRAEISRLRHQIRDHNLVSAARG